MTSRKAILSATFAALLLLSTNPSLRAADVATNDLTARLAAAGVNVQGLHAVEVGGIVILKGKTTDHAIVDNAMAGIRNLGYTRVADLVTVTPPPDDAAITRTAERKLGIRALDGCSLRVDSSNGVLLVAGSVHYELQKDVALGALRNIDGVREIRSNLQLR